MKLIATLSILLPAFLYGQCSVITNSTDAVCKGDCTGFIQAIGNGATPIDYSWSSGDTTSLIPNVCAGTYILTMTDDTGCVAIDTVTINEPTEFVVTLTVLSSPSDSGNCDAIIHANMSGGTPGYTYSEWIDCQADTSIGIVVVWPPVPSEFEVCQGSYALIGYDSNMCVDTSNCISINDPVASMQEENYQIDFKIEGNIISFELPIVELQIVSINGRQICHTKVSPKTFLLCDKSAGIYVVTFESLNGKKFSRKIHLQE